MDRNVNYVKMLVMNYAMIELDYPEDQTCGIPMPKPDDEASSDEFALLIEAAHEVADMVLPGGRGALKEENE